MKKIMAALLSLAWFAGSTQLSQAQDILYAPVKSTLFAITDSIQQIGDFPCMVNPHSFTSIAYGATTALVYWNSTKQTLVVADAKLKTTRELPLEGSSVWLSGNAVLAVSKTWENGFAFTLYRLEKLAELTLIFAWQTDLFVSDALIENRGVLIAGGTKDNAYNRVLWCAPGKKPEVILETPKDKDFIKLIPAEGNIYLYASAQAKTRKTMQLWYSKQSASGFLKAETLGLTVPKDLQCWFGSGFFWRKELFIPAWNGSDMLLVQLSGTGTSRTLTKTVKNIQGVYFPLGQQGSSFWYLGYDYYSNPNLWYLSSFNGTSATHRATTSP